jgi:hypothetical protein
MFMEQIDTKARDMGVLSGVLSRWILPYDSLRSLPARLAEDDVCGRYGDSNQSVADQKGQAQQAIQNIPAVCCCEIPML